LQFAGVERAIIVGVEENALDGDASFATVLRATGVGVGEERAGDIAQSRMTWMVAV